MIAALGPTQRDKWLLLLTIADLFHALDDGIGSVADLCRGDSPRLPDPVVRKLSVTEE